MKQLYSACLSIAMIVSSCAHKTDHKDKELASKSIDNLYQQFSKAYQTLDVDLVSNLYTEDANYLPGNANQAVMMSREPIRKSFASYFEGAESMGRDLKISFRIVERNIDDSLAYDIGYYLLQSKSIDMEEFPEGGNAGKFVTAMGLQQDGTWKFLLDGFSPAPYDAFFADSTSHNPLK